MTLLDHVAEGFALVVAVFGLLTFALVIGGML